MADVWFVRAVATSDGLGEWNERHLAGPFDIFPPPELAEFGFSDRLAGVPGGFPSGPTDIFL